MDYIMGKIQHIEQKAISNSVEISGVPTLEDEDLYEILHRLFEYVNYQITNSAINDLYRTKPNKKSSLCESIIVAFDNIHNKKHFIMH
jgi:hypothetical protein